MVYTCMVWSGLARGGSDKRVKDLRDKGMGTMHYTCMVRSGLSLSKGFVWWTTMPHVGHVLFSAKCFTIQLLQNVCRHSMIVVALTKYLSWSRERGSASACVREWVL